MDDVFNFGKYRGRLVSEVPSSYLAWCLRSLDRLSPWLRQAIEGELRQRDELPEQSVAISPEVVRDWYGRMAMEFHPDRGGSNEAMKAVNRGRELLEMMTE